MKFSQMTRAPEGLTSYAKVKRLRPTVMLLNVVEGLLACLGVVVLILLIRYHSFEKAGLAIDQALGCVAQCAHQLLSHLHK